MFTRFQALNQVELIKPFAEFVETPEATHPCELTLLFLMVMATVLFSQMSQGRVRSSSLTADSQVRRLRVRNKTNEVAQG